jgi:hypothetical protein
MTAGEQGMEHGHADAAARGRRSLKRRLSDVIYHRLISDLTQTTKTAT